MVISGFSISKTMSLNNILKTIKSEAEAEAAEIHKQGEEEVKKIEARINELSKKEQEKILTGFRNEMEKKVTQAKFRQESRTKTLTLEKKRKILDKVYDKVIERIAMDSEIYAKVMGKIAECLPRVADGEIWLAKENSEKTKKVLKAAGVDYKMAEETVGARGGFILKSKTLEIDNTIEAVAREARESSEIEAGGILFGEDENN